MVDVNADKSGPCCVVNARNNNGLGSNEIVLRSMSEAPIEYTIYNHQADVDQFEFGALTWEVGIPIPS